MKFPTAKYWFIKLFFVSLLLSGYNTYASEIPEPPQKKQLVNDLANILNPKQEKELESLLLNYFVKSSSQIAVVTVDTLNGYEPADFATRLAEKWGIGTAKHDNGILLLVKPKTPHTKGRVFIATGYGMEGAATDMATGQIIRNQIIPHFKHNDYYKGIAAGCTALIALTKGEYTELQSPQNPKSGNMGTSLIVFIFMIILFIILATKEKKYNRRHIDINGMDSTAPFWTMLFSHPRHHKHSGTFDDFQSGSGDFGDFGGFGGFGGGSFGGGGAGGSW